MDAAIASRQWTKAVQILEVIRDNPKSEVYFKKIAEHYANIGEYEKAERFILIQSRPFVLKLFNFLLN